MFFDNSPNDLDRLAHQFGSDKGLQQHGYTRIYHRYFSHLQERAFTFVEIGVANGSSLKMWEVYFPQAKIFGIDINPACKQFESERSTVLIGDQSDIKFLGEAVNESGPVDVLIDDGGHTMRQQQTTLSEMFKHISPGGVYIIEDLHTSYWRNYGSVLCNDSPVSTITVLKNLVDYVNFPGTVNAIANSELPARLELSKEDQYLVDTIDSIHFYPSMCFIFKKG
jgi:hypothetical protein